MCIWYAYRQARIHMHTHTYPSRTHSPNTSMVKLIPKRSPLLSLPPLSSPSLLGGHSTRPVVAIPTITTVYQDNPLGHAPLRLPAQQKSQRLNWRCVPIIDNNKNSAVCVILSRALLI